jgi:hypothetical protein
VFLNGHDFGGKNERRDLAAFPFSVHSGFLSKIGPKMTVFYIGFQGIFKGF